MVPAMAKRLRRTQHENPVHFTFDGEPFVGRAGESLAVALWAAGVRTLTRSPKYHRPRGPFCFTGQCEGCLLRVQDTPNTMACQVAVEEGLQASSQNHLGSLSFDLLRAADWMFPKGLNHHEFMAGVPVAEDLMKAMARRIAGLGTLPDGPRTPLPPAVRISVEVLVVGGGISGNAVASALPEATVIDVVGAHGARRGIAIGVYGAQNGPRALEVLVVEDARTVLYAPHALVLAPGAHEGLPTFVNNDLPGILSLRAATTLLAHDVAPGHAPVVVETPGGTGLGRELARAHGYRHVRGQLLDATGGASVERVTLRTSEGDMVVDTDALVVDAPRAPSFELAVQAGAQAHAASHGFSVRTDAQGLAAPGVWVVGEAAGINFDADIPTATTRALLMDAALRTADAVRATRRG